MRRIARHLADAVSCILSCCIVDVQLMNARQWLAGRAGDGGFGQA